jgi:chromosomal replication initiation ATPase DnaA
MGIPEDVVIHAVVQAVSETFGISTAAISGKVRTDEIVDARRAIALMLNNLGYRPQRIARAINRDRSTIYNLIDTAKELMDSNLKFRCKYADAASAVWMLP